MADKDELDAVFDGFAKRGATEHHLRMLEAAMRSSPELNRAMTDAILNERVLGLHFLPPESPASAWYAPTTREIGFQRALLDVPLRAEPLDRLAYAFGHEISHAQQDPAARKAELAIVAEIRALAESGARPRDYTALVERYDALQRDNEARAELNGINTLADRMKHEDGGPISEKVLAKRAQEISSCTEVSSLGRVAFKPGLSFDPKTQSLPVSPQNIEAVAACFYDIKRTRGGYPQASQADAIGYVADAEFQARRLDPDRRFSDVHIDLAKLKLDPETLRKQSVNLGLFRDGPFEFVDTGGHRVVEVRHTAGGNNHPLTTPPSNAGPADPRHADHGMLEQIRAGLRANADQLGRPDEQAGERLGRAVLAACKDNREMHPGQEVSLAANALGRVDHVVVANGNVFAIEGRLDDPEHKRATVNIERALGTPVEQSDQKLQSANQAIAQEQERARQLSQQQTRSGPTLIH
ncbi:MULTISPECIES: XVIPCD domain-containing protein [unclassified Lysobacter]|uniref:XVIPCD domain-containing protein n=1 Tax=unclassified Lysobacter TaxID=2635362 RepID=UPI001BE755DE|nr:MULTISPECIES: XVIPCD domain-containing protein [unclassified Lysobacter]MBT2747026.1 hypothetical protein [Lysobacter sp. ISL-42]MBT2750513.1 hypothetical protein [Lysobacter sp. ISL-50]MBT2776359.1 hypothetical protein [Lysobacter sp. ISL-54]MBT2780854.1 hypothetical protein [Lysobacter sp. ISL-52]